jgi:hypothetical protein
MSTQWENPPPQRDQWCPTPTSDARRMAKCKRGRSDLIKSDRPR